MLCRMDTEITKIDWEIRLLCPFKCFELIIHDVTWYFQTAITREGIELQKWYLYFRNQCDDTSLMKWMPNCWSLLFFYLECLIKEFYSENVGNQFENPSLYQMKCFGQFCVLISIFWGYHHHWFAMKINVSTHELIPMLRLIDISGPYCSKWHI